LGWARATTRLLVIEWGEEKGKAGWARPKEREGGDFWARRKR